MHQIIGLRIYGPTNYAVVNTVCNYSFGDTKLLPHKGNAPALHNRSSIRGGFGYVTYFYDSEVLMNVVYTTKDDCIRLLKKAFEGLITDLEAHYPDSELIHPVPELQNGENWPAMVEGMKKPERFQDEVTLFKSAKPIKVKDFKNAYEECFVQPTYKFKLHDPFIIERRRLQTKLLYDLADTIGIDDWYMAWWLATDEATESNFMAVMNDEERSSKIIKKPEFSELVSLVKKMRKDQDWIEPKYLFKHSIRYEV